MFDLSFWDWYWIIGTALVIGTAHYLIVANIERERIRRAQVAHEEQSLKLCLKQQKAKLYALRTEVVRTRYMVDAWLSRNPRATLRHPGAKIVLHDHMNALRAFFDHEGCVQYASPDETAKQYDNPYWRAVWHIYHHGNVRALPPCPLES